MPVKDAVRVLDGVNGTLVSHLPFGDLLRSRNFVSPGRGSVNFERLFHKLKVVSCAGPLSVE